MIGREINILSPLGFLGIVDMVAAFLMLWSFLRITTHFGWRTRAARWALFRRMIYGLMTIALFGLGVGRLDGRYIAGGEEIFFQIVLLSGVMVFPLLRAFGLITQDALHIDSHASKRNRDRDPVSQGGGS